MAKRKSSDLKLGKRGVSWRDRRWKIYENKYGSNARLREELANAVKDKEPHIAYDNVLEIITNYGVPRACITAVLKKLYNPDLNRSECLKEIRQPITYWNAAMEYIGPDIDVPPAEHVEYLFRNAGLKVTKNGKEVSGEALLEAIAGDSTFLQLDPYVNISEIRELINDYWKVDLEKMVRIRSLKNDKTYGAELIGVVQPKTKAKRVADRDALIMKLYYEDKKNDIEISTYLIEETKHAKLSPEYIRVIISRNKKNTS